MKIISQGSLQIQNYKKKTKNPEGQQGESLNIRGILDFFLVNVTFFHAFSVSCSRGQRRSLIQSCVHDKKASGRGFHLVH